MKIKEIYDYQRDFIRSINQEAKQIHPKLLSRLSYKDFFNEEFNDDSLQAQYNANILPKIKQYRLDVESMCQAYLLDFITDMAVLFGTIGYDLEDGVELNEEDVSPNLFVMNYLPSPEIAPVWDEVQSELMVAYNPTPFWATGSYWATGEDEKIYIESRRSPTVFIRDHRNKISKYYGHTVTEGLIQDVALYNTFEYPIHIEPMTAQEERAVPTNLREAVRRHAILRYMMEEVVDKGVPLTDDVLDTILAPDGSIVSMRII